MEWAEVRKWRQGEPLHVGWWQCRCGHSASGWRWWDGAQWSQPAQSHLGPTDARAMARRKANLRARIEWRMDWPKGARVARINPVTGVVTGVAK